jgi:HEAT repeat protein
MHLGQEYDTSVSMAPADDRSSVQKLLGDLLEAERRAHALAERIAAVPADRAVDAIAAAVAQSRKLPNEAERIVDLCALGKLLGRLGGASATDLLVDLLGSDEPEVRYTAGDVLTDVGHDRWKELALAVERALESLPVGNPALSELPYVLAEIPEAGATKLLHKFLGHADPEAVAAAIEIAADLGDGSAVALLAKLEGDRRFVAPDDETQDDESGPLTIGELAAEARAVLESVPEGD